MAGRARRPSSGARRPLRRLEPIGARSGRSPPEPRRAGSRRLARRRGPTRDRTTSRRSRADDAAACRRDARRHGARRRNRRQSGRGAASQRVAAKNCRGGKSRRTDARPHARLFRPVFVGDHGRSAIPGKGPMWPPTVFSRDWRASAVRRDCRRSRFHGEPSATSACLLVTARPAKPWRAAPASSRWGLGRRSI